MIQIDHIKKYYESIPVLEDISFRIAEGERVSLLGPGGCGKSTILKIILGLLEPNEGQVDLMGIDMVGSEASEKREILKSVGMAFQQGALFDFMTVHDNLKFAMENMTDLSPEDMEERIKKLLSGVKLSRAEYQYPYELSGGMQRRVGIARALATDPTMAIFDEPTAGLDPVTSTIILNMIIAMGATRPENTLLIATSNVEIGIRFAERVIVINEGRVVADGPWKELILDGPEWVQKFLSVRLIGLDKEYAYELNLPDAFIKQHWEL